MSEQQPANSSRRTFMKNSTLAALGGAMASGLTLPSRVFAAGDDTIRIGLVGCGGRGGGAAEDALKSKNNVKLVAVADVFEDHLTSKLQFLENTFQDQPGRIEVDDDHKFVGFDAYKQLIDSDVDLVILATPPGFRPLHFEYAIEKNKHVFMEKPVATDGPGVRKVLAAVEKAKEKDLKVGVGLQRHHQTPYLETIKQIKDGAIGDVVALRVYWNGGGVWDPRKTRDEVSGEMEYQVRNWYYYTWLCGDHIVEQHIHNLDVGNWIMDDYPTECHGIGGRQVRTDKRYGEIYDHHAVEYTYGNGTKMFSQCAHIANTWSSVSEHAHGTKGYADVSGAKIEGEGGKWRYRERNSPYEQEHVDLQQAIIDGNFYNEGENGAKSTLTAIMGRMATYSGKLIKWEDAMNSEIDLLPKTFAWDALPKVLPDSEGRYPVAVPGVTEVV